MCVCVCVCAQSCPTLCSPMDYSPQDSSVHGTFQARILELAAISYDSWLPFPTPFPLQGLNLSLLYLLHWQVDSLPLVPPGKPIASVKMLGGWWSAACQFILSKVKLKLLYVHLHHLEKGLAIGSLLWIFAEGKCNC